MKKQIQTALILLFIFISLLFIYQIKQNRLLIQENFAVYEELHRTLEGRETKQNIREKLVSECSLHGKTSEYCFNKKLEEYYINH